MRKTTGALATMACVVSLIVGIVAGHVWQFPSEFVLTVKAKYLSPFLQEIVERTPDLIHSYKFFDDEAPIKLHVFQSEISDRDNQMGIIFFHGGGWTNGTADIFYPQCTRLATIGIECISAEYRTSSSHNTSPLHAVEDAKDAYQYVVSNSHQLGINSKYWYVAGASAGGHLAASIVSADYPEYRLERAYPQGVILLGPVIDNRQGGFAFERVKYFGERFSPLHNLDERFPRTLFIVGDNDRFVPSDTAMQFVSTLDELGVEATLKIYKDAYHSFYLDDQFSETMEDIEQFVLSDPLRAQ